jgi:N-acetylglucosaminyldiphosphoundecaprenol N-acetyl-beta-D-mannosaminyltransferase
MDWNSAAGIRDDLSREVYCILGMPVDAVEMPAVLGKIGLAAESGIPLLISTLNINFLAISLIDPEFREQLLLSDLCTPDGVPIIWIARLLGIPIKRRVAGADIFEALKSPPNSKRPLRIFLFGSTEPVAAAASERLNSSDSAGMQCVGWACPGFGTVEEMGQPNFINRINSSKADFLVAALGAKKGQQWLLRNHRRLEVPIRAHLGATINFQAGTVRRAPPVMQKYGLEWLWRIKEEPSLLSRYWHDAGVLLRVLVMQVLPFAIVEYLRRMAGRKQSFVITRAGSDQVTVVRIRGYATAERVPEAIACLRRAIASGSRMVIDLSATRAVDARFFGLFLMLRKQLKGVGSTLQFTGPSPWLRLLFRLNGLGYLLPSSRQHGIGFLR